MLKNKKILITAGPTREWMDPVRFLSNPSSGGMGIELARVLQKKGVHVTLVLGPTHLIPPQKIRTIPVVTALQMKEIVMRNIACVDAFVATAAVGDWRFARVASNKLKKGASKTMTVKLIKTPDILAEAAQFKKHPPHPTLSPHKKRGGRGNSKFPSPSMLCMGGEGQGEGGCLFVGFALETNQTARNALKKLREKNLDLIIANNPNSFSNSSIRPTWIERSGLIKNFPAMSKKSLSQKIAQWLERKWNQPK